MQADRSLGGLAAESRRTIRLLATGTIAAFPPLAKQAPTAVRRWTWQRFGDRVAARWDEAILHVLAK